MTKIFGDFDASTLWKSNEYSVEEYEGQSLTDAKLNSVQAELRYKLPATYIDLIRIQNGGMPKSTAYKTEVLEPQTKDVIIAEFMG